MTNNTDGAALLPVTPEMLTRMSNQISEWEMDEPRSDWWQYQRDFADAHSILSKVQSDQIIAGIASDIANGLTESQSHSLPGDVGMPYAERLEYEQRIHEAEMVAVRLARLVPTPSEPGGYVGDNFYPVGGVEASHEWDGERWNWLPSLVINDAALTPSALSGDAP